MALSEDSKDTCLNNSVSENKLYQVSDPNPPPKATEKEG